MVEVSRAGTVSFVDAINLSDSYLLGSAVPRPVVGSAGPIGDHDPAGFISIRIDPHPDHV